MYLEDENRELRKALEEKNQEIQLIKKIVQQGAQVLGLDKAPPEKINGAYIIKRLGPLFMREMTAPGTLEKQFSFFKELLPLIEKYKDEI